MAVMRCRYWAKLEFFLVAFAILRSMMMMMIMMEKLWKILALKDLSD